MMATILTCGFALTACGDDDEDDKPEVPATAKAETAEINYSIRIDNATKESIQKAVTFTVEYYDQDGELKKSEPLKYGNTEWNYGGSITKLPANYGIKVTLAPKADLSGISDTDVFNIKYDVLVAGTCQDAKGNALDGKSEMKKTVEYKEIDVKALAADNEKFEDTFFYNIDANGNITKK